MSTLSPIDFWTVDNVPTANVDLVEIVARETAKLGNRHAWPAIWTMLRSAGKSASVATALRADVWADRKRNAAAQRALKAGVVA
jgi:hypothetical protein